MAVDPRKFKEWMNHHAEYEAMLKTELKGLYDEAMKGIAEWDKRRNYDQLRSSLEQDKNTHATTVSEWEKVRDKYNSDMQAWHTSLTKQEADLKKKASDIAAQSSALLSAQSTHESNVKMHKEALDKRAKELDKREADLNALQGVLHTREVDLAAKHTKVQSAISSLSSLR